VSSSWSTFIQIERERETDRERETEREGEDVPGVKVTASGFNSRADSESKTSYTH